MKWKYGMAHRPISFCTVPKGYLCVEMHPNFRHGVVVYERELREDEIASFELTPLVPLDYIANNIIGKFGHYGKAYLEQFEEDRLFFEIAVAQQFDSMNVWPDEGTFDREKLALLVVEKLRSI
jgi:hypothetical protein